MHTGFNPSKSGYIQQVCVRACVCIHSYSSVRTLKFHLPICGKQHGSTAGESCPEAGGFENGRCRLSQTSLRDAHSPCHPPANTMDVNISMYNYLCPIYMYKHVNKHIYSHIYVSTYVF